MVADRAARAAHAHDPRLEIGQRRPRRVGAHEHGLLGSGDDAADDARLAEPGEPAHRGAQLDHASGDTHLRKDLRGGFYRSPLAAAAFTLGAANLVGVPMLSVFITKVTMAQAAVMTGGRHTVIALCALAISTLLNAYYFLGTTMQLYIPDHEHPERNARVKINVYAAIGLVGFIALNLTLSFCAQGIFGALLDGLTRFA